MARRRRGGHGRRRDRRAHSWLSTSDLDRGRHSPQSGVSWSTTVGPPRCCAWCCAERDMRSRRNAGPLTWGSDPTRRADGVEHRKSSARTDDRQRVCGTERYRWQWLARYWIRRRARCVRRRRRVGTEKKAWGVGELACGRGQLEGRSVVAVGARVRCYSVDDSGATSARPGW